ncbi:hypothetical protein J6590_012812 [Homalodisca vitripennis]|nr:hypothetical protein J6590_012812 [Homalodisca vitripennis]
MGGLQLSHYRTILMRAALVDLWNEKKALEHILETVRQDKILVNYGPRRPAKLIKPDGNKLRIANLRAAVRGSKHGWCVTLSYSGSDSWVIVTEAGEWMKQVFTGL